MLTKMLAYFNLSRAWWSKYSQEMQNGAKIIWHPLTIVLLIKMSKVCNFFKGIMHTKKIQEISLYDFQRIILYNGAENKYLVATNK